MYIDNNNQSYQIRNALMQDLDSIAELERICFPEKEAATKQKFRERLAVFNNYFWLLEEEKENGRTVSMVNGMLSDEENLVDEMYENSNMHRDDGKWMMIFGVETRPEFQKRGLAGFLLEYVIEEIRKQRKNGIVLTCKEELLPFYERLGFVNEGVSKSTHGDALWYQMRLKFKK